MKIGIALGGGGAKGFAHVGVLKAFTNAGIDCDVIAGTSMGALVGAFYASGDLGRFEEHAKKIKVRDLPSLLGPTWPRQGFFSGRGILRRLEELIEVENIEQLGKPFAAVCADLNRGEIFTFTEGNLRRAVRASIAIPAIFTPVFYKDKVLVDGGLLEPIPVEATRSLGADFVIAVDLLSHSHNHQIGEGVEDVLGNEIKTSGDSSVFAYINSVWEKIPAMNQSGTEIDYGGKQPGIIDIIRRTSVLTQKRMAKYRLNETPADFVLTPDLSDIDMFDLHLGERIVKIGEKAAEQVLSDLIEKLESAR